MLKEMREKIKNVFFLGRDNPYLMLHYFSYEILFYSYVILWKKIG